MRDYFKWSVILIIFIGILWMMHQCRHTEAPVVVKVQHDTTYSYAVDTFVSFVPMAAKIEYVKGKVLRDTLETTETILQHVDSARILEQYLATRSYDTTVDIRYGKLVVKAEVTQNRVINAEFGIDQKIPIVTNTVTLTQPKRAVLLFGIQAFGNQKTLPYASGVTLDLKLRSDAMIGGGAYLTRDQPMYSAALKFPIRFKKR